MKGLELARAYYEEIGLPMLRAQFGDVLDRIAVGLVGHGSECFGYDDDRSADHDYGPGFCLWLTEADDREFGFRLFRAYEKLPREFRGYRTEKKSRFGSDARGVHTIGDFYAFYTGTGDVPGDNDAWLSIPDAYLAEATNGELFTDPLGEFTRIREGLLHSRPEDVRRKKLASCLFYMAQTGQYNYARCLAHGEPVAATLALSKFAENTAMAAFLLEHRYAPYYKWLFRALGELPGWQDTARQLTELLSSPFDGKRNGPLIEAVAAHMTERLKQQSLPAAGDYLEPYAYAVNDRIRDGHLRNMPVML